MHPPFFTFYPACPTETIAIATCLAQRLRPGDVLLLEGEIGAGKTHFARGVVQALLDAPEDVPSPTFTLVQTYNTRAGEVWHADLYRLTDPYELAEIGLENAWDTAICLIEWPGRLGDLVPDKAITLRFAAGPHPDARDITLSSSHPKAWRQKLEPCLV